MRTLLADLSRTNRGLEQIARGAKTRYIVIQTSYTHIVAFWQIGNIPQRISWSQICYNTPMLYMIVKQDYWCSLSIDK